jgi:hypothetical protein
LRYRLAAAMTAARSQQHDGDASVRQAAANALKS